MLARIKKKSCGFVAGLIKTFSYLCITAIPLFFQSCQLEPDSTGNVVEPQILDYYGFPANIPAINASIGSYPISIPDMNGYCHFENVSIPYALQVNGGGALHIFNKLNIKNPRIVLPYSEYYSWPRHFDLHVKFPPVPQGKAGLLQFISKDLFKQINGTQWIKPSWTSAFITIVIPVGKRIEGKLIFLQGEVLGNYLHSFDNFGFKDVTISTSQNDTVEFTQDEIQFNPPESYVRVSPAYPEQSTLRFLGIYIYFPGFKPNSEVTLMANKYPSPGPWVVDVPGQLNFPYDIKIRSTYRADSSSDYHNLEAVELFHLQPGASANIIHTKLELLGPQDYQTGITKDSCLRVKEEGERGIYLFAIAELESGSRLTFVTEKNTIRCGDLKYRNFEIRPGKTYKWIVYKTSRFSSVDEFTETAYMFSDKYHSVRLSEIRYFSTAP